MEDNQIMKYSDTLKEFIAALELALRIAKEQLEHALAIENRKD